MIQSLTQYIVIVVAFAFAITLHFLAIRAVFRNNENWVHRVCAFIPLAGQVPTYLCGARVIAVFAVVAYIAYFVLRLLLA